MWPAILLSAAALLAACSDETSKPVAVPAPVPAPTPAATTAAADGWLGRWNGPEGTYLDLAGGQGRYEITIRDLDGPKTYQGRAEGDAIVFERGGMRETIRAGTGDQAGMKWLAGRSDCLVVRAGEGYCRGDGAAAPASAPASAAPASQAAVIPPRFRGEWNAKLADCGTGANESRMRIEAGRIRFYESSGKVRSVEEVGANEIVVTAEVTGEGQTAVTTRRLRLSPDGRTLQDVTEGAGLKRHNCPTRRP